jgi:hypothetical protein
MVITNSLDVHEILDPSILAFTIPALTKIKRMCPSQIMLCVAIKLSVPLNKYTSAGKFCGMASMSVALYKPAILLAGLLLFTSGFFQRWQCW